VRVGSRKQKVIGVQRKTYTLIYPDPTFFTGNKIKFFLEPHQKSISLLKYLDQWNYTSTNKKSNNKFIYLWRITIINTKLAGLNVNSPNIKLKAKVFKLESYHEAGFLNKRLMLSSSFRCDQIYKYEIYNFGHTLLCYLSRT
jgi:hypothetical protein